MGNAPPISEQKLKELRKKYDKDNNGLEWEEFKALAVEVGELQGLKKPVSEEKLKTIFLGLDEDKSGVVSIQEFEAAYAKLEEQLQAAAKAKSKAKAKADAKPKAAKAKAKAKAAEVTLAEGQTSIFDAMPGFNSFVRDLGISSLFEEDSRVPKAKAIPTPKKVKPPPLPEPQPPPLSSQVPWSTQLKAADPDWYDEDDAGYDSSDSFPEAGELPEEEVSATAAAPPTSTAPAALAAPGTAPAAKVAPVTPAAAPPKATEKPKAPAPKKAKAVKPKSPKAAAPKPKVVLREPKGRAQGVSAVDGVTDDVFSSPIHRREAVAHPQDAPDPQGIHVLQTGGGMEMIQQDPEVLSEPESQDSVDSISGEIARSWDPTATDVRYSYARDRAVGFSESWRPLKWSTEEWERRLLASGNLRHRVGIAKQKSDSKPKAPAPQAEVPQVEDLIAPEKPKVRSQYPLATEVKPKFIDVPLSGLQGVAAQGAVSTLRKSGKAPVAVPPAFEDPGDFDELYHSVPPPREPLRPGEPLVPLSSVGPPHLRESRPIPAAVPPKAAPVQAVPQFGQPWQPPSPLFTAKPAMPRPVMQEVRARPSPEEEGPDPPGRTWL